MQMARVIPGFEPFNSITLPMPDNRLRHFSPKMDLSTVGAAMLGGSATAASAAAAAAAAAASSEGGHPLACTRIYADSQLMSYLNSIEVRQ